MLKTWLLYHHGRYAKLPASLQRLEAALTQVALAPDTVDHLRGEMAVLHSLLAYLAGEVEATVVHAQESLEKIRPDSWRMRSLARLTLAAALQMRGDLRGAYAAIYDGFVQEEVSTAAFKATLLSTACFVYWMAADLQGLAQAAAQCIALSQDAHVLEILNQGHNHLGRVRYQQNELAAAEGHFSSVVQRPYLNYGGAFVHSACGLALTHQAQGRPDEASQVAESAVAFMLETGNTTLLPEAQAFQAELALKQGKVATARQWAAQLDLVPPLKPIYGFFSPHLTLVKVWLAQDTPASRRKAADLLSRFRAFVESIHNSRFLIETLALQALLDCAEGDESAALTALKQAIALAEPGGFIRLFVDLGSPMARLLEQLYHQGVAPGYIAQILAAFGTEDRGRKTDVETPSIVRRPSSSLIEPLTPRESQVLALLGRHLTNKEIATQLVISPLTVKSHTLNIYHKLDVRRRQEAVARAKELGIL